MFSRQRKARVLFGLSDLIVTTIAFELAYELRAVLHLEHLFFLTIEQKALVLGSSLLAWVMIGLWLEIYEKLDSAHPAVILRDTTRQCAYGALGLVLFEYLVRLDLSRFFVAMYAAFAWVLLVLFRMTAGRVVGVINLQNRAPHQYTRRELGLIETIGVLVGAEIEMARLEREKSQLSHQLNQK